MKQIIIRCIFCLGILFFITLLSFFVIPSKNKYRESFLDNFMDIDYTPPESSISDQQKTFVNVNILKQAVITMNEQIETMKVDISNLQDQVVTLTNQQSDTASSATPDIQGTSL